MAYHRRRKNAATNKKIRYKKPSAANQRAQILAINKKLNSVHKQVKMTMYTIQHSHQITGALTSPFSVNALCDSAAWGQVFSDTSFQSSGGGKYTGYRMSIDFRITPRTEHSSCNFTVFIAYPKTIKVVNETGGAASATCSNLVLNRDYVTFDGMSLLNKRRWGIVKGPYRITSLPVVTESSGTEYINATKANRRYCNVKNPLKVNNRTANWNQMQPWDIKPRQRYHILVFNNNVSALEGSPTINIQTLMSGQTSA